MDPIEALEQSHALDGLGRIAVQIFSGSLEESDGDTAVAMLATVAALTVLLKANGE